MKAYDDQGGELKIDPGEDLWVLVTASRTWTDYGRMHAALNLCAGQLDETFQADPRGRPGRLPPGRGGYNPDWFKTHGVLHVMQGDAPGGDRIAKAWTEYGWRRGWAIAKPETRPADWDGPCRPVCYPGHRRLRYGPDGGVVSSTCPTAGFYRNQAMVVELSALTVPKLVLAFIHNESRGATQCLKIAKAAGLPWLEFRA